MSRSRAVISALALAAAACNGVLGLDATERDSDGDGVPDAIDNCPSVANADQINSDGAGAGDACTVCSTPLHVDLDGDGFDDGCDLCLGPGPTGVDSDGDGIDDGCDPCVAGVSRFHVDANHDGIEDGCEWCIGGGVGIDIDHDGLDDACDQCLNGPPHDEDGDGVEDGCDNCPALANPGQQVTTPGDLRGTACATANGPYLAMFDPFLVDRTAAWATADPAWTVAGDQLHVAAMAKGLERILVAAEPSSFDATTRARFTGPGASPQLGVMALATDPATIRCDLGTDGVLALSVVSTSLPLQTVKVAGVATAGAVVVRLSTSHGAGALSSKATCSATGIDGMTRTTPVLAIPDPATGWHPGLVANDTTATFDFFEIAATVQVGPL